MSAQVSLPGNDTMNITEYKSTEVQHKAYTDELAQSNRELERFAYVVSHDLKTPLQTISTRLKFWTKSLGTSNDNAQYQLERISVAVIHLERLLDNLLAHSRVSSEGTELVPINTQTVIAIVLKSLEGLIQEKHAVIQVQSELPVVLANEMQLCQVFQNLISNGIKFCTSQPQIAISGTRQGQKCTFCVADKGTGISDKSKQQIFETFQGLHDQSEYEGSDIGLSIVKQIIQQLGGRIWVESELGQGRKFFFTLKEASNAG